MQPNTPRPPLQHHHDHQRQHRRAAHLDLDRVALAQLLRLAVAVAQRRARLVDVAPRDLPERVDAVALELHVVACLLLAVLLALESAQLLRELLDGGGGGGGRAGGGGVGAAGCGGRAAAAGRVGGALFAAVLLVLLCFFEEGLCGRVVGRRSSDGGSGGAGRAACSRVALCRSSTRGDHPFAAITPRTHQPHLGPLGGLLLRRHGCWWRLLAALAAALGAALLPAPPGEGRRFLALSLYTIYVYADLIRDISYQIPSLQARAVKSVNADRRDWLAGSAFDGLRNNIFDYLRGV